MPRLQSTQWTDAELREATPTLPHTSREELRALLRWAGPDRTALAIAARGTSVLGFARWCTAYEAEPEAWLSELGGADALRRWQRSLRGLDARAAQTLRRLAISPVGFELSAFVASTPGSATTLAPLLSTGWVAWRGTKRLEVPPMRRALLPQDDDPSHDWLLRYTRRIAQRNEWTAEDRTCMATCLRDQSVAKGLHDREFARAASALRRTPHAELAIAALRARLADDACSGRTTLPLRQTLGGALIELGAYQEARGVLRDRSRISRVMRAHTHIRTGNLDEGLRLLRVLGPRDDDENWPLQWALAAIDTGDPNAEDFLRVQLEKAYDARLRGLVWTLHAELSDRQESGAALAHYERAIANLEEAGDEMITVYCQIRYARALARVGRRDDAAQMASDAWCHAQQLPGASLRGLAALACVEAGIATTETLQGALRAATNAELPELARDAKAALGPECTAPILALGRTSAHLDGIPLALTGNGPPWRLLTHLCQLPSASIVTVEELFRVGWPDQRAKPESRRKRVHTAIWTLRRAGLRDALQTTGRNQYRLDARIIVDEPAE